MRSRGRILLGLVAGVFLLIGAGTLAYHFVSVSGGLPISIAPGAEASDTSARPITATPGLPWFVNVAEASGITFRHYDCVTPMQYIQESLGSGLAWIDYNNDGWPDLFVVQAGPVRMKTEDRRSKIEDRGSTKKPAGSTLESRSSTLNYGPLPTNKMYRNNGDGTFTDVTEEVGLARSGFGLGCAVGDFDNDGWDDLVVTYMGGIVLYHNESDGKGGRHFVDVTAKAGLDNNPNLATSCAWGDVDGDGLLDLYVCNYVEVDFDHYPECFDPKTGLRMVCPPTYFPNVSHRLYRNNGDGTFTDISSASGIAAVTPAPGLAVLMADLDGDGRMDIYVANDLKPSYLFHNQGNKAGAPTGGGSEGTKSVASSSPPLPVALLPSSSSCPRFVEKALLSGCALDTFSLPLAGMGIEAGDLDGSGWPSLFVTNFQQRPSMLYWNRGGLRFEDGTYASGLGAPSLSRLKFGTVFIDADLDGHLDVAVANGHVQPNSMRLGGHPTEQEAQLFLGDGHGRFREVSHQAGAYFTESYVGRGLAWADYDNDGRPDLAFSHVGGPIALLHNQTETTNNWITLELVGEWRTAAPSGGRSNRNAIGARVEIYYGGQRQVRFINGGGSYLSASERRVLAGLGNATRAQRVLVTWPSGRKQEFHDLEGLHWYRLQEGERQPVIVTPGKSAR